MKLIVKTFYHPLEWMFSGKYVLLSISVIELDENSINVNTKFEDDNLKKCLKEEIKYRNAMYKSLVKYHRDFSDVKDTLIYNYYDKLTVNETIKKHFDDMVLHSCQTLVFEINDLKSI